MNPVPPRTDPRRTARAVETELKLAISPAAAARLRTHPAIRAHARGRPRTTRVVSTYHDTPDRRLARAGVALRVRREGRRWLMTVKGEALPGDAMPVTSRPELEWTIERPEIDTMRLATTPWRALFAKALRKGGLVPVFVTDFVRTSLPLAFPDGTAATLAIDLGHVGAGTRRAPIAEIELELAGGDPCRLVELATRLAADLPVSIEPRSKAERGYALADGIAGEPSRATEVEHADEATARGAIASIVAGCVRQIARNSTGLRDASLRDPEWVHQMRIGVRRLRSCLALADGIVAADALDALRRDTRWALDALGPARDLDVFAQETLPAAMVDLARTGGDATATVAALRSLARRAAARRRAAHAAAVACVSSTRCTRLVLAATAVALSGGTAPEGRSDDPGAEPARRFAARLLDRRARRLARAAARLAEAGPDERHAIRIAAKKLRYAAEFFATLFPRKRSRAYRRALADLQDELGAFNDATVAPRITAALAGPTASATVAVEAWSAARAGASAPRLADAWARFAAVAPFWSRG
ncbi:Inorganic triphosphatase [Burkholderiales bacterium]|nr:Inorganic triphosphatase [Burkholderiales bacterium]